MCNFLNLVLLKSNKFYVHKIQTHFVKIPNGIFVIARKLPKEYFIAALTKIDKPKSLKVAKELTSANNSYELIIRRANLNVLDANELA